MRVTRSTLYAEPSSDDDDTAVVEAIATICDEFESYGWRRVRAALRQQGMVVNHKKVRRLMREHDLQPRVRRRYTATTDSDHDQPIFLNLADGFSAPSSSRINSPGRGSNQRPDPVRRQGPTPIGGQCSVPFDSQSERSTLLTT